MFVPTPGTSRVPWDSSPLGTDPALAFVLDCVMSADDQPRLTSGTYCNCLLTETFHEVRGVLVTQSTASDYWVPRETDSALVKLIRDAISGLSGPFPEPTGQSDRWGSMVLVEWISGMPFIRTVFPHSQTPKSVMPVVSQAALEANVGAEVVNGARPTGDVSMPNDDPPEPTVPTVYAKYAGTVYIPEYQSAWMQGFPNGWSFDDQTQSRIDRYRRTARKRVKDSGASNTEKALSWARYNGFNDGVTAGQAARAAAKKPQPVATPPDWKTPDTDTAADQSNATGTPARTGGKGRTIHHTAGTRIIVNEDGSVIIDTRDGATPVYVQSGDKLQLVATGDVHLGSINAADPVTLWPGLKAYINAQIKGVYDGHTHTTVAKFAAAAFDPAGVAAITGCPSASMGAAVAQGEATKVKGV